MRTGLPSPHPLVCSSGEPVTVDMLENVPAALGRQRPGCNWLPYKEANEDGDTASER